MTAKDLPSTIQKITATFDSHRNSSDFEFYKEEERERLFRALRAERMMGDGSTRAFVFDIHPYQQEILNKLNAEREVRGKRRKLVATATGTGKTVISLPLTAADFASRIRDGAIGFCSLPIERKF